MRGAVALLSVCLSCLPVAAQSVGGEESEQSPQVRVLRPPFEAEAAEPRDGAGQGGPIRWERSRDGRSGSGEPEGVGAMAPSPGVPLDLPETQLQQGARLRQLDKMTGQTRTFEIGVGEARQVERLRIRLDACRSPADNDLHGTIAFLKIWDTKDPAADAAFSGWMFAESPALSALDHPRYDLWVISCTTSEAGASGASD